MTNNLKFYDYYYESYSAVLSNFIGNYEIETENEDGTKSFKSRYGLKAFLPIAKNYSFLIMMTLEIRDLMDLKELI